MVYQKRIVLALVLFVFLVLVSSFTLAESVSDDLHINIQLTYDNGTIKTGSYNFEFNVSSSADCSNIVYSDSVILDTDSRGIISRYLENVSLDYNNQYWLCYYLDGTLKNSSKLANSPYAFYAKNVSLSGVIIDSNLDMGSNNISTTGWFKGLFNWIIDIPSRAYLSFNGTTLEFNETKLNNTIDARATGDNVTWNEARADTLYAGNEWGYNMSDGSYNATYDNFAYNQTYSGSTYNATYAANTGDNSSWNESYADGKYAYIIWSYNQTDATYNLYNDIWTSTYNATYASAVGDNSSWNQSYADTLYSSYLWNYNQTLGVDQSYVEGLGFVTGAHTINTNESIRFNNIVETNCAGNDKMIGVYPNGTIQCSAVAGGGDFSFVDFQASWNSNWSSLDYDKWMYNQTTPANTYTNTVNSSQSSWINSIFLKITDMFTKSEISTMIENNITVLDNSKLDKTDQRYNETTWVENQNYLTDYTETDAIALSAISGNDSDWSSTYNSTYDVLVTDNVTWNEARADGLYSDIKWGYNMSDGSYNATYDNFAYNQTYSGSTYNATYAANTGDNSSWNESYADDLYYGSGDIATLSDLNVSDTLRVGSTTLLADSDGMNISGTVHFNSGWQDGGATISNGNIFAQALYVFNISSVSVDNLRINGTITPGVSWDNAFDLGKTDETWKYGYFGTDVFIGGASVKQWMHNMSDGSYNATYDNFAYNQTIPANTYTDMVNSSQSSWVNSIFLKITDMFTKSEISTTIENNITAILSNNVSWSSTYNATYASQNSSRWDLANGNISYSVGNVGIGISTPSEKLDVVGNIKTSSNISVADSITYSDDNPRIQFTMGDTVINLQD